MPADIIESMWLIQVASVPVNLRPGLRLWSAPHTPRSSTQSSCLHVKIFQPVSVESKTGKFLSSEVRGQSLRFNQIFLRIGASVRVGLWSHGLGVLTGQVVTPLVFNVVVTVKFTQPVYVMREDRMSRQKTIGELKRRATSDDSWPEIVIFPEGTCTNGQSLIAFKPGTVVITFC